MKPQKVRKTYSAFRWITEHLERRANLKLRQTVIVPRVGVYRIRGEAYLFKACFGKLSLRIGRLKRQLVCQCFTLMLANVFDNLPGCVSSIRRL